MNGSMLIYTDGCCKGNPSGCGGYGVVLINEETGVVEEYSQGYQHTTNNRMELMAFYAALENIPETCSKVLFVSDSKYAIGVLSGTMKAASNLDLVNPIRELIEKKSVEYRWVKGHNGDRFNERCDELANISLTKRLVRDIGYERTAMC